MGYAVLHLDKSPGNESAMTDHIERKVIHPNVDTNWIHLNKELIEFPEGVNNRTEAIQYKDWLPDMSLLIRWGEHCESIGFSKQQARDIIAMKPFRFTGEIYSSQHSRKFTAEDVEIRLERGKENQSAFRLMIGGIDIVQWCKQKYNEFREAIGFKPKQQPEVGKSKGIKR